VRRTIRLRARAGLAAMVFAMAAALSVTGSALGSGAAAYTTAIDDGSGNPAGCLNGQGINCNNYSSKDDVYVNGGPTNGAGLPEGTYYFAVLVPGYQHDGFIDGHEGNLSDTTGGGDSYLCRELTVDSNGAVTYTPAGGCTTGAHLQGIGVISGDPVTQLSPYDDTTNNGGVYIMAICEVGATSSSQCKYDAFKINSSSASSADDLTVSKTATPTFTREFPWSITKTACLDGTGGTGQPACATTTSNTSGVAKFNYVVTVTKGAGADSGWDVTGTITVTNPNSDAVSGVNVSDKITYLDGATVTDDPNAGCTIISVDDGTGAVPSDGTDQTIAANSAYDYTYDCPYANGGPANGSETNTAKATWPDIGSDHTSATIDVPVSWSTPTTVIHNSVTVGDVITSTVPSSLPAGFNVGAATPTGGLPDGTTVVSATKTYNYSRTLTAPRGCLTVNNRATFNVTDPDDQVTPSDDSGNATASAQVCRVPVNTGALTMGYWQNKNGQGIILNHSGASCQALKTWLTGSNFTGIPGSPNNGAGPFADLSATACGTSPSLTGKSTTPPSGVVGYVYTVIKNATCSSTSKTCNSMLKAQMLATALNVYFSDGTLGGNWINASTPIGGVTIDLTQICKMIDGTGGTATCSGTYEDASSAFGGASSLTVLQMLNYAASQSTSAGATWYLNVKVTQVVAKDAFDAINNKVAFSV
jgi:hypothetical protein